MSAWIIASLILAAVLLLVTPVASTFQSKTVQQGPTKIGFTPAPLPLSQNITPPYVTAKNIFIIDQASKTVFLQQDADEKVPPASTTKMMTALVALDNYYLPDQITVTQEYKVGQVVDFKPGEKLTVEQLLYALLVQSANDAAEILAANYCAPRSPKGEVGSCGREAFIQAMNNKAAQIHLTNTHFTNPSGIDEDGHYSSATDLARLADVALRQPEFAKIVATENAVVSTHILTNVNQLLGKIPGVIGVKTGYTEGAKQALVTLVNRNDHPVILVVLGSDDRFADTTTLIDWVYSGWKWKQAAPIGTAGQ